MLVVCSKQLNTMLKIKQLYIANLLECLEVEDIDPIDVFLNFAEIPDEVGRRCTRRMAEIKTLMGESLYQKWIAGLSQFHTRCDSIMTTV